MNIEKLDGYRICSKHFSSGQPSHYLDGTNPDWVPHLHTGYSSPKTTVVKDSINTFLLKKREKQKIALSFRRKNGDERIEIKAERDRFRSIQEQIRQLEDEVSLSTNFIEESTLDDEINDNEEILIELDECLRNKNESISQLKQTITSLEDDIKRYTSPYNCETGTLEQDITVFKNIASKYVKKDLIDFYADRMQKCATNSVENDSSTISALCEFISKNN